MKRNIYILVVISLFQIYCSSNVDIENKTTKYSINASDLNQEFRLNEIAAKSKYSGEVVEVTGTVSQIREIFGTPTVVLNGFDVQCGLKYKSQAQELKPGETVKVKGIVDERHLSTVTIDNCIIVSVK